MSPEVIGAIGLVVMLVLIFLKMWIGIAMLLSGFVGFWVLGKDTSLPGPWLRRLALDR